MRRCATGTRCRTAASTGWTVAGKWRRVLVDAGLEGRLLGGRELGLLGGPSEDLAGVDVGRGRRGLHVLVHLRDEPGLVDEELQASGARLRAGQARPHRLDRGREREVRVGRR